MSQYSHLIIENIIQTQKSIVTFKWPNKLKSLYQNFKGLWKDGLTALLSILLIKVDIGFARTYAGSP